MVNLAASQIRKSPLFLLLFMKATPILLIVVLLLLVVNLLASFGVVGSGPKGGGQYAVYNSAEWGQLIVMQIAKKRGLKDGAELTFSSAAEARYEGYPLVLDALAAEGWEYISATDDGLHIVCGPKGASVPFRANATAAAPSTSAPTAPTTPAPAPTPAPAAQK